jgi:hypothetical protein
VVRFAFALVGAAQPAPSHTISEYVLIVLSRRSGQEDRSRCGAGAASRFPTGPPRSDARFHFVKRHTRRNAQSIDWKLPTLHPVRGE